MAVEPRRGCGFRKVGGMYLVSKLPFKSCHRLPFPLTVCPTCNVGIKQSRGWTWVNGAALFAPPCGQEQVIKHGIHCAACPVCTGKRLEKAGLLWIGERFYPNPRTFEQESVRFGTSRRIKAVPRGFKLGETFVLLAHPKAIDPPNLTDEPRPGVFQVFLPERVEMLITESQATKEKLDDMEGRKITPVVVPDNDKDHQGTVYDKDDEEVKS